MRAASSNRLSTDLAYLADRDRSVDEFAREVSRAVARAVPFDGFCLMTTDPATRLPTSAFVDNGLPPEDAPRLTEIEYAEGDLNTFNSIARSGRASASLAEATGGDLEQSRRHRELRAPKGWGDELRTVLMIDSAMWGTLTLGRSADREPFAPSELAAVAAAAPHVADGLRRALLRTGLCASSGGPPDSAGIVLIAPDNTIASADAAGSRWLGELGAEALDAPLPPVVAAVLGQARGVAEQPSTVAVARAWTTGRSGWLTVRASTLGEGAEAQVAVILEPASQHELAPLVVDAYLLTNREREITRLVAQGLTTEAIASTLHLSPWTVQDHLKSIFEKVGVSSRGELVARIYFEQYEPSLS